MSAISLNSIARGSATINFAPFDIIARLILLPIMGWHYKKEICTVNVRDGIAHGSITKGC
jgi:hypothetical protein